MATLSEIETLAKESHDRAVRTAITLFKLPEEQPTDAVDLYILQTKGKYPDSTNVLSIAVAELLSLPKHIIWFVVDFSLKKGYTVKCEFELQDGDWPLINKDGIIETMKKRYKIHCVPSMNEFITDIVGIFGKIQSATWFNLRFGKNEDPMLRCTAYAGNSPYSTQIEQVEAMKKKYKISLEEIEEN